MEPAKAIGWRTSSRELRSTHASSCIKTSDTTNRSRRKRPKKTIKMLVVTPKTMSQSEDKKINEEEAEIRTTWMTLLTTKMRVPSLVCMRNLLYW